MASSNCEHVSWLYITGGRSNPCLRYEGQYERVVREMTNPSAQFPGLIFFMGTNAKDAALPKLFPHNDDLRKRRFTTEALNLRIDNDTSGSARPILFADCDPTSGALAHHNGSQASCHSHENHPINWIDKTKHHLLDILIARLFFWFTDLVCVFADDVGGLEGVKTLLLSWATIGSAAIGTTAVRPRVLVVTSKDEPSTTNSWLGTDDVLQEFGPDLRQAFATIELIHSSEGGLSAHVQSRRLHREAMRQVDLVHKARVGNSALLSAVHQNALFVCALQHTARTIDEPFDHIIAARAGNELSCNFQSHLENFLELCQANKVPDDAVVTYIASSILMNAYPPGSPAFAPHTIYASLYRPLCMQAFRNSLNTNYKAEWWSRCIEEQLASLHELVAMGKQTSSDVHIFNSRKHSTYWELVKSNITCLFCLACMPEHCMPCGHAMCDACVQRVGQGMIGFEYQFVVPGCTFCHVQSGLVVKLKPPTAGVRIVSLDGGGTRGIITLKEMSLLQDLAGPDLPIQDFFDLTFGTSVGGLSALSLVKRRWHVARCIDVFRAFAKQVFPHGGRQDKSVSSSIKRLWKAIFADGIHNDKTLEEALMEQYGPEIRMFGYSPMIPSGHKVAVIATTTNKASAVVFANYNGTKIRPKNGGYHFVRPREAEHEPFEWQAGRATSAAPAYFRYSKISPIGTFQDGCLKYNNPTTLALVERRLIWPSIRRPDVVLSFGTGTNADDLSPQATHNGTAARLYRWGKYSIDAEDAWKELLNQVPEHERCDYHRLNVSFSGPEPPIDDPGCMDDLSALVQVKPQGPRERKQVISDLLITSLFFELDEHRYEDRSWRCRGSIRCRLRGPALIQALRRHHSSVMRYYKDNENLGVSVREEDVCEGCYRYVRPVEFTVRELTNEFCLSLRWDDGKTRRLSGFPQSADWFIHEQQMVSPFGNPAHGSPGKLQCSSCLPFKQSPKKDMGGNSKKRRLASPLRGRSAKRIMAG